MEIESKYFFREESKERCRGERRR